MTKKISALTAASSAAAANEYEINEAGTSKKVTGTQIGTLMATLLNATFAAIGTTISAAGLATGGGSLAANRTITVTAASDAEARTGTATNVAVTPANLNARAYFHVTKSADQTGIASATSTLLTWATEAADVGGYFASNAWTPPAGPVRMSAGLSVSAGLAVAGVLNIHIFKNASNFKGTVGVAVGTGEQGSQITCIDVANGTDAYTVYIYAASAGTLTVRGDAYATYFCGEQL